MLKHKHKLGTARALIAGCFVVTSQLGCVQTSFGLAAGSLVVDSYSTYDGVRRNPGAESNPILGRNPAPGEIGAYFAGAIILLHEADKALANHPNVATLLNLVVFVSEAHAFLTWHPDIYPASTYW